MRIRSLDREDPLEEGVATHSGILAWRIPWTEKPGGLQSTGSKRVGYDWSDSAHMQTAWKIPKTCILSLTGTKLYWKLICLFNMFLLYLPLTPKSNASFYQTSNFTVPEADHVYFAFCVSLLATPPHFNVFLIAYTDFTAFYDTVQIVSLLEHFPWITLLFGHIFLI